MTPCEEKGWKEGQIFEAIESTDSWEGLIQKGAILVLDEIRVSSDTDKFTCIHGQNIKASNGGGWGYLEPHRVKRIYPPEQSKDVTVTCEGKETIISRESAKELNLL